MIKIRGLKKSFGGHSVLKDLELDVPHGETLVVIGRSGCGKSVLLKHILGLVEQDAGEIWVDGVPMSRISKAERIKTRLKFGMVFQNSALFDSMSVGDNVGFGLEEHTSMDAGKTQARVEECLGLVGLSGQADQWPAELSGGMRKRVALARAVAMNPEILLYDEPTTGLDPITADAINDLMVKLKDSLRVTSIAVTHDIQSAYKVATRMALMYEGRIHWTGTPEEIQGSSDPVVRQFIEGSREGPIKL